MLNESHNSGNTVLQFSGGKDSLAVLNLMQPYWNQLTVVWVNTGAAYPETLALMERVCAAVPNFVSLRTNQPESVERNGYPVDVVPIRYSSPGHAFEPGERIKIRPYFTCCGENIWEPLQQFCVQMGVTTIIRGQRNDERMRGPVRGGNSVDGITYLFPIEDWTEEQVFVYLESNGIDIPEHYSMTGTSLDCMGCTAYLHEIGVHQWMKERHPLLHEVTQHRLAKINAAVEAEMGYMRKVLEL